MFRPDMTVLTVLMRASPVRALQLPRGFLISIQHFNTQAWMQFCYVRIPSHQILSRQMIPLMARVLNTWKQAERHLSDPLLQILHIR